MSMPVTEGRVSAGKRKREITPDFMSFIFINVVRIAMGDFISLC